MIKALLFFVIAFSAAVHAYDCDNVLQKDLVRLKIGTPDSKISKLKGDVASDPVLVKLRAKTKLSTAVETKLKEMRAKYFETRTGTMASRDDAEKSLFATSEGESLKGTFER